MKNETNSQFVARLMEQASTGPLMQAFVLESLRIHASDVLTLEAPDNAETGFISWTAWQACAAEVSQAIADRHGKPDGLEDLIDLAIKQVRADLENGDQTALVELLRAVPRAALAGYLPETT